MAKVTVNDDGFVPFGVCWICGAPGDHDGVPHSTAVGDGVTRHLIVDIMNANGWSWRHVLPSGDPICTCDWPGDEECPRHG